MAATTFKSYRATFHEGKVMLEPGLLQRENPKMVQAQIYDQMMKDVKKLRPKPNRVSLSSHGVEAEWILTKPMTFHTQDEVNRFVDQINKGLKKNWFAQQYSLDLLPACDCDKLTPLLRNVLLEIHKRNEINAAL